MPKPHINEVELQQMIDAQPWRKSDLKGPHEYFLKQQNPELFNHLAHLVKKHPAKRDFQGIKYIYFIFNGWRYWHFRLIMNRAKENNEEMKQKKVKVLYHGIVETDGSIIDTDYFNYFSYDDLVKLFEEMEQ